MRTLALLTLLLVGCGPTAVLALWVKPAAALLDVPAAPGVRLRVGDGYTLRVDTAVPAYFYAFAVSPDGAPRRLFPVEPDAQAAPAVGTLLHLPQKGRYVASGAQGVHQVVVIAARSALSAVEQEAALGSSGAPRGADRSRGADPIDPKARSGEGLAGGAAVRARFNSRGVALLRVHCHQANSSLMTAAVGQ